MGRQIQKFFLNEIQTTSESCSAKLFFTFHIYKSIIMILRYELYRFFKTTKKLIEKVNKENDIIFLTETWIGEWRMGSRCSVRHKNNENTCLYY